MMNEDCEPLMEPAALTTRCTKVDVMTSLSDLGTINQPTVTDGISATLLSSMCAEVLG